MKVRFAVSVGVGTVGAGGAGGPGGSVGADLAAVAVGAEERGFDTLWMSDLPTQVAVEPLLATAHIAACTSRLRLGVNLIPFGTTPYLVAHRLAQLDHLTAGRLLVILVPGLDLSAERSALGTAGRHRGKLMDEVVPQLRAWWAGSAVEGVALPLLPVQDPLEIWLGGSGPEAVERAGRLADGWMGSLVAPSRAGELVAGIQAVATAAGRTIDPEHFGLSVGYVSSGPVDLSRVRSRVRRPEDEAPIEQLVPAGRDQLRRLVGSLVEAGLSKFVLRPLTPIDSIAAWAAELDWLAGAVLDLQT